MGLRPLHGAGRLAGTAIAPVPVLSGTHARYIRGVGADRRPAVGHRVVKLIEHKTVGRQIALLDRAIIVALERLAQEIVSLAL